MQLQCQLLRKQRKSNLSEKTLSKVYDPKTVESKCYKIWEREKMFSPTENNDESFTIMIPPPNVTGILHIGHCLNNTIQDILIRRKRMQQYDTLWLPGMDHASIATEAKVTKMLKDKGINKKEIGRDEFLKHAWKWKDEYGGKILNQLEKLGLPVIGVKQHLPWISNILMQYIMLLSNYMKMD